LDLHLKPVDHVGEQLAVVAAAEGGVEVDQVDPLGAGRLPGQRGGQRIAVAGRGPGRALDQPDRLAALPVDGGQEFELGHARLPSPSPTPDSSESEYRVQAAGQSVDTQLASSAAPASPDFSGWNWVAHSAPFSTAATNGRLP